MPGTIPPTKLLLTRSEVVVGSFDSYSSIALYLGIKVEDGVVHFMGHKVHPTYGESWTNDLDIIRDWAKCYMKNHLPSNHKIYKYLDE
jgi:hypothetical protein